MATVSDIPDHDSGVASPEVTPDGQIPHIKKVADSASSASEKIRSLNSNTKDENSAQPNCKVDSKDGGLVVFSQEAGSNSDEEDDESLDESLAERLWGLTEMFPETLRSVSNSLTSKSLSFVKGTYQLSRQVVWIGVSTSILLFAPVMFEIERFNVEEMVKQDRNRLVLGPGSAMSGPPGAPGLAPPPSR